MSQHDFRAKGRVFPPKNQETAVTPAEPVSEVTEPVVMATAPVNGDAAAVVEQADTATQPEPSAETTISPIEGEIVTISEDATGSVEAILNASEDQGDEHDDGSTQDESETFVDDKLAETVAQEVIEPTQVTTAAVIEPVVVAAPAPVVSAPVEAPVVQADTQVELSEEEQYLNKIRIDGTMEQKRILAAIETFCEQLRPKAEIPPEKACQYQHEFLQHLVWIVEKEYEVFKAGWNVLLVYFSAYHGQNSASRYSALSEYNTDRYLFAWNKGTDKVNAYRGLTTLLRATRNKATRKHDIKTLSMDRVAPNVITDRGLSNLKQFYAV